MQTRETAAPTLEDFVGLLGLLAGNSPPDTIIRALVEGFLKPFDVERASLHITSRCGRYLQMVGDYGYPSGSTDRFTAIDVTIDLPVTEALHQSSPMTIEPARLPEKYPALRSSTPNSDVSDLGTANQEWIFAPIQMRGHSAAALALLTRHGALQEQRNLVALQGVTHSLALWLQHAWDTTPTAPDDAGAAIFPLTFTERQIRILAGVLEGKSNSEIAEALGCSPSTVKQDLKRATAALGVTSRREAANRAWEMGLIPTTQEHA